jgi:pimeloyl-ACP methyl ester carboxylesterase
LFLITLFGTPRSVASDHPFVAGSLGGRNATDTTRIRSAYLAGRRVIDSIDRAHHHVVRVNGLRMHFLAWGDPSGVPLVWLHGSAGSAYEIRHLGPRLAALGYRVIAPSYRGHGQSITADYEFTIYHVADDMVALLDSLQLGTAVFGGSSKGGFIAGAVYDQYPARVRGLLLSDGGSWSNQWDFDHHGLEGARRQLAGGGPPSGIGASEWELFRDLAGPLVLRSPTNPPADRVADMLVGISQRPDGRFEVLQGFDRMMGSPDGYLASATAPSTLPLLQWSQHAMIPVAVFRNLDVPMVIIDPQSPADELPVTDQNERLARLHPRWVIHKIYPETGHAAFRERPDWFLRDAAELLGRVRSGTKG